MLHDRNLEKAMQCITIAKLHNIKIATAESCTGGLLSAYLTAIPGSSAVFERGFITYSNTAKVENLQVNPEDIEKYGAVSAQVAVGMATGALQNSQADLAIGITGIAGPASDNTEKPVGLVYIGLSYNKITQVKKYNMTGDRHTIRISTVFAALEIIEGVILNQE